MCQRSYTTSVFHPLLSPTLLKLSSSPFHRWGSWAYVASRWCGQDALHTLSSVVLLCLRDPGIMSSKIHQLCGHWKSKLSRKLLLIPRSFHSLTYSLCRASTVKKPWAARHCLEDDTRRKEEVLTSQNFPASTWKNAYKRFLFTVKLKH